MIKTKLMAMGLSVSVLAAGCVSNGLSPREGGRQNYPTYLFSLYDADADPGAPLPELRPPIRLAVAQIGEVAPPEILMQKLRAESSLFSRVESIPGIVAIQEPRHFGPQESPTDHYERNAAQRQMQRMMELARGMGTDHLLVFGGTLDHAVSSNNLALLDLTIVGIFAAPSKELEATGRAAASLVNLRTERVVLTASAESEQSKLSSSAEVDENRLELFKSVRDELAKELGEKLIKSMQEQLARQQRNAVTD